MSQIDQIKKEIKRACPDKKMAEELDKMCLTEIVELYHELHVKGKMRK